MDITIFTSAPNLVDSFCSHQSILHRALNNGIWSLKIVDIRQYGRGLYRRIDDYSYGGGGMLMRPDVLGNCIDDNIDINSIQDEECAFIYMSPRGIILNQNLSENIAKKIKKLYILCGRFEGIDQRIIEYYNIQEVSIGNYILFDGEVASIVLIESIVRLLPGTIKSNTLEEESFSSSIDGMLEYDQFTKPHTWKNISVPDVLCSGDHNKIKEWRIESARRNTIKQNSKERI